MTQRPSTDPRTFLPLSAQQFHILLALTRQDRHGYGIILDVAERTEGQLRLGTGTLYTAIGRLTTLGLIEDTGVEDGPRRHYHLTPLGKKVLQAEASRLEALVRLARNEGVAPARSKP